MTLLSPEDRADIQAIVTSGFGHLDHAGFLFLRVLDAGRARQWLASVVDDVTSAAPWPQDAEGHKIKPDRTVNVALSADGLGALGVSAEIMAGFPAEFLAGMASRATVLGDTGASAPETWELGGPNTPELHVLVILHAATEVILDATKVRLEGGAVLSGLEEVAFERGARVERSREHFGFANDGISEPEIDGLRRVPRPGNTVVRAGEFLLGHVNELGFYPSSPPVPERDDPDRKLAPYADGALPGFRDLGRNGSYLVYRKLAQDVAAFWCYVQEACDAPGIDRQAHESMMRWLAAKFLGRWPSGAPMVLAPDRDAPELGSANDFAYRPTDPDGFACPVGAHIRRANPRDALVQISDTPEESLASAAQHRILRRGIRFGDELFPVGAIDADGAPYDLVDDGKERGLHFVAVNADTKRQFEFVQQSWLDNPSFNGLFDNKDPMLGDNDGSGHMTIPAHPARLRVGQLPRFVSVKGGGYWFVPSLGALAYLGG